MRTAWNSLDRVTGIRMDRSGGVTEVDLEGNKKVDFNSLVAMMIENRSELKYLMALIRSKEFSRNSVKGEYLPTVDLSLKYSQFGDSVTPTGRDGLHDDEVKGMFLAEWKLAERAKKSHDVRAENEDIRAIKAQIADTEEELKLQLKNAVEEYRLAEGRQAVADRAVAQAEENYRITDSQYRQRIATTTDILEARVFLSRARNDFNNAVYDIKSAIIKIERVVEGALQNKDILK